MDMERASRCLPNQVLNTHAARVAAKQLKFRHLWWPRVARAKGSGQSKSRCDVNGKRKRSLVVDPAVRKVSWAVMPGLLLAAFHRT